MKSLRTILRHLLVWWLPCIAGLVVILAAFLAWALGTQAGTSFLLRTAVSQLDGEVEGVRGSVLNGLSADRLRLALPGVAVDAEGLRLQVAWRELGARVLRVRNLSADALSIALTSSPDERKDDEPDSGEPLSLPVKVVVDRLALGRFALTQDGEPLPVSLGQLNASGRLDESGLSLGLGSLAVGHDIADARLSGTAQLATLAAPWPMKVDLAAAVRGAGPASPLCEAQRIPGVADAKGGEACAFQADLGVAGSLDGMTVSARIEGGGLRARADAELALPEAIPVRRADVDVSLANGSGLSAALRPEAAPGGEPGRERLNGTLSARRFDAGALLGGAIPSAVFTAEGAFSIETLAREALARAELSLDIAKGSIWNGQPLSGSLAVRVAGPLRPDGMEDAVSEDWTQLRVTRLDTNLALGGNRVRTEGGFGDPKADLTLDVQAPRLADFWPGLPGGATVKGRLGGSVARHDAELDAEYLPGPANARALGEAPMRAQVSLEGGWGGGAPAQPAEGAAEGVAQGTAQAVAQPQPEAGGGAKRADAAPVPAGWRGRLRSLRVSHAGVDAVVPQPMTAAFLPAAQSPDWQWTVGAGELALTLPGKHAVKISHRGSRGGQGRWETAGSIADLVISGQLIEDLRKLADPDYAPKEKQGGVKVSSAAGQARRIGLDLVWDLRFNGALAGTARVSRRSGDLAIPGDPPVPMNLRELALDVKATPTGGGASRLDAALVAATEKMGRLSGSASAALNGLALAPRQPIRAKVDADIDDLGWIVLLTGDSLDVGGRLRARVEGQGTLDGAWTSSGTITGDKLRVVRVDDGVRLLDGTLSVRLDNDRVVLESLRFPAVQRVTPNEWRTRTWITEEPDAQNGELRATGNWNLSSSEGGVQVVLHRFPILQRSDRYAMMSGKIDLKAALPSVRITGGLTADAGWVSAEMMSSVPRVDDDVIVRRASDQVAVPSGMDVAMNLTVDLGPRFYLTGMGIDSGLVGNMQVILEQGKLTGLGAFRTRGGRFEAYGQRLHLRRGVITFQGNIANPLLDIEALRLGEQVEAGVRVGGTAQRPRIDLVSYPDVSDVDKLSWLILGRGADQSGSDAALLISLGTSLLGGGEPFYRRLGLDDVGIKSGAMGSSGSLLPDTTVAGSVTRPANADLETQFMYASKSFANGLTLSVEQALAGADTVGRLSYSLARGLSLDVKGGSVNGLELVYRAFWGN